MDRTRSIRRCSLLLVVLSLLAVPASAVKRRAFVTSVVGTGNMASWAGSSGATALDRADSVCRARAAAGGLPNATAYRAWLSTPTVDAYCHVQGLTGTRANNCNGAPQPGGGPWYLANGITPFTPSLAALTGPERVVFRPVIFDEFGDSVPDWYDGHYWSGTGPDGALVGDRHCAGWTSTSHPTGGWFGTAFGGSYAWSIWGSHSCTASKRLLCFEPGASETTNSVWSPGSLVFVTTAQGNGNLSTWAQAGGLVGIDAGDAVCRTLAAAAHLPSPSSFVAWLSDSAADAADRVTSNGPYRRLDGYAVANSKVDLVDGATSNSIHVNELFDYIQTTGETLTGTAADGTASGFDCDNWSHEDCCSVTATRGYAALSREDTWTAYGDNASCESDNYRLYCFSNVVTLFWDGFDYTGDTSRWTTSAD